MNTTSDLTTYTDPVTVAQDAYVTGYKSISFQWEDLRMVAQAAKELAVNHHCLIEIYNLIEQDEISVAAIKAEYKEALRQNRITSNG